MLWNYKSGIFDVKNRWLKIMFCLQEAVHETDSEDRNNWSSLFTEDVQEWKMFRQRQSFY